MTKNCFLRKNHESSGFIIYFIFRCLRFLDLGTEKQGLFFLYFNFTFNLPIWKSGNGPKAYLARDERVHFTASLTKQYFQLFHLVYGEKYTSLGGSLPPPDASFSWNVPANAIKTPGLTASWYSFLCSFLSCVAGLVIGFAGIKLHFQESPFRPRQQLFRFPNESVLLGWKVIH